MLESGTVFRFVEATVSQFSCVSSCQCQMLCSSTVQLDCIIGFVYSKLKVCWGGLLRLQIHYLVGCIKLSLSQVQF